MKKKLFVLIFLPLFYSCQYENVKTYQVVEETNIKVDTLDIEQIKIETH